MFKISLVLFLQKFNVPLHQNGVKQLRSACFVISFLLKLLLFFLFEEENKPKT